MKNREVSVYIRCFEAVSSRFADYIPQESRMKVTHSVLVTSFFEEERVYTHIEKHLHACVSYACMCVCVRVRELARENSDSSATSGDYFKVNLLRSSTTHFTLNSFISSWTRRRAGENSFLAIKTRSVGKNKNYVQNVLRASYVPQYRIVLQCFSLFA